MASRLSRNRWRNALTAHPTGIILAIAWRNTWRQPRRTLLTTTTISLGLVLMLVLKGLSDGALHQMVDNTVRMGSGHVVIQQPGYLDLGGVDRRLPGDQLGEILQWLEGERGARVQHALPRSFVSGMASSADGAIGARITGIDPEREAPASRYREALQQGRFLDADDDGQALLGAGAAGRLAVAPGDRVVLMAQGIPGDIESILVRVAGVVRLGLDELDDNLVLIPLDTAREFLGLGTGAHQVAALLGDAGEAEELAREARRAFPELEALTWAEAHPELLDLIQLVGARDALLSLVVLSLVGFLVLNTLQMAVLERTREFALLEALGFAPAGRFAMVMAEATVIAGMAVAAGLALGGAIHLYLATTGLSLAFFTDEGLAIAGTVMDPVLYSRLSARRLLELTGMVFAMTLALALMPASRAARTAKIGHLGRN